MSARRSGTVICVAMLAAATACSEPFPTRPDVVPYVQPVIPSGLSAPLTAMLTGLFQHILDARAASELALPNNPVSGGFIVRKIEMLKDPALPGDIIDGRRWIDSQIVSSFGSVMPLALVFALEPMREEAALTVQTLQQGVPVLETFMGEAFPTQTIKVWYGFEVGAKGGGGVLYLEEQSLYETRTGPGRLPYHAIVLHEASHSYISNEALNQFLEVYAYNVSRGRGTALAGWDFTRGWGPDTPINFGVSVVLDVYALVGHDVMQRAYRAIRPLRPAYGQPLTAAVLDAFVAQVPEQHRAAVRAKLATIIA
jgi:hypothetical protein